MARSRKASRRSSAARLLALALIGAGLVTLGLVALIALPQLGETASPDRPAAGVPASLNFPAPELQLIDLNGVDASLSEVRGRYVLVNNWATWCPPCRAEMPILEEYYQDHRGEGFSLIAIEAGDPVDEVERFVEQFRLSFPVWLDPSNQALQGFSNNALPSSYLIDPRGTVIMGWSGAITRETLDNYVTPLLVQN